MSKQEYNIIDTIDHTHEWISRYPELEQQGEGLLVILEPEQITTMCQLSRKIASVRKPNGQIADYTIHHFEVHHGVVGIFFKDLCREDIPRGSMISWE